MNYFDLTEAVNYTGIEKQYLVKLVQQGVIAGHQIGDDDYRFSEETLEAMASAGLCKSKIEEKN